MDSIPQARTNEDTLAQVTPFPVLSRDISVVIVNYNSGSYLEKCIRSILTNAATSIKSLDIIVVDNASSDDSIVRLMSFFGSHPKVRIQHNIKNVGFAKACNQGTKMASGDYIIYLNPDCEIHEDMFSSLLDTIQYCPKVGMVGAMLLNTDGTEQPGGRRAVPTPWRSFVRAFGLSKLQNRYPRLFSDYHLHSEAVPEEPIPVEAISGACMMVSRKALEDVGPMDEGYFMHCEDLDWCMRFRKKDWNILFVPDAKVTHVHGGCSQGQRVRVEWHKHKGMVRFYRQHFRHQYPSVMMWMVVASVWFRYGAWATAYGVSKPLKWFKKLFPTSKSH